MVNKIKKTLTKVRFTPEQKQIVKEKITLAVEEAYLQGKEDGAREQQKIIVAREKAIAAAIAKFDKEQKKLEKPIKTTSKKNHISKKIKAIESTPKTKKTLKKKIKAEKKGVEKLQKISEKNTSITTEKPLKKRGRPPKSKPDIQVDISSTDK